MKAGRITVYFLLFTSLLYMFSCSSLKNIFQEPELSLDRVEIKDISFSDINLNFHFNVDNPNTISLNLSGFEYEIFIENKSFLKGNSDEPMTVKADAKSNIDLPVSFNFKQITSILDDYSSKEELSYRINIKFLFVLPVFGKASYTVEHTGSFPAVKLPELKIEKLVLKSLTLLNADFELQLLIKNNNSFSISIDSLNYEFRINNAVWGRGLSRDVINFKEKGEQRINISIKINPAAAGSELIESALKGKKVNMNFRANALFRTGYPGFNNGEIQFATDDIREIVK